MNRRPAAAMRVLHRVLCVFAVAQEVSTRIGKALLAALEHLTSQL